VLPAPLHAATPTSSPGADGERGVPHARHAARVHGADARGAHHHGPLRRRPSCAGRRADGPPHRVATRIRGLRQGRLARRVRPPLGRRLAEHRRREVRLGERAGGVAHRPGEHRASAPQHRDRVGVAERVAKLVRHEHRRPAGVHPAPQPAEQLLRFVGAQHGARLVEDEDARRARQRLDDLEPLLRRHG
jgi:hypothetical protein